MEYKIVKCPACGRTLTHHICGTSIRRDVCQKCGKTVYIYSAGKTVLADKVILTETLEIKIEF